MIIVDGLIALFLNANFEKILPILGITCLITFLRLSMKISHFIRSEEHTSELQSQR